MLASQMNRYHMSHVFCTISLQDGSAPRDRLSRFIAPWNLFCDPLSLISAISICMEVDLFHWSMVASPVATQLKTMTTLLPGQVS